MEFYNALLDIVDSPLKVWAFHNFIKELHDFTISNNLSTCKLLKFLESIHRCLFDVNKSFKEVRDVSSLICLKDKIEKFLFNVFLVQKYWLYISSSLLLKNDKCEDPTKRTRSY